MTGYYCLFGSSATSAQATVDVYHCCCPTSTPFPSGEVEKWKGQSSCAPLLGPHDCSPPGSSVHPISQARRQVGSRSLLHRMLPTQVSPVNSPLISFQNTPPKLLSFSLRDPIRTNPGLFLECWKGVFATPNPDLQSLLSRWDISLKLLEITWILYFNYSRKYVFIYYDPHASIARLTCKHGVFTLPNQ